MPPRKTAPAERTATADDRRKRRMSRATVTKDEATSKKPRKKSATEPDAGTRSKYFSGKRADSKGQTDNSDDEAGKPAADEQKPAYAKGKELWREGVRAGLGPGKEVFIEKPKPRDQGDVPYQDDRIHPNTLLFLRDLKENNDREWLKRKSGAGGEGGWNWC